MEWHTNRHWKQFLEGMEMAPDSKKMTIVGFHILHGKKENTTEPFHIAYSENIDQHMKEIVS